MLAATPPTITPNAGTAGGGGELVHAPPTSQAGSGAATLDQAVAGLAAAVAQLQEAVAALQARMGTQPVMAGGAHAAPSAPPPAAEYQQSSSAERPTSPAPASAADPSKWLTGNIEGLDRQLVDKLAQVGERIGKPLKIVSGHRSRAQQQRLYDLYKAGKGNLAAKPGSSKHETGNAADVNVDGKSLALNAAAKQAALDLGLHFPVKGEPWHVEVKR